MRESVESRFFTAIAAPINPSEYCEQM